MPTHTIVAGQDRLDDLRPAAGIGAARRCAPPQARGAGTWCSPTWASMLAFLALARGTSAATGHSA